MDLVLNSLQRLICHKTQLTNQLANNLFFQECIKFQRCLSIRYVSFNKYFTTATCTKISCILLVCCEQYWTSPDSKTPKRHQLYGHLPPITKTIQVRRTRHAGHYWRSRDELISDVLRWTPAYGRAKEGRPARTYIQQLCEDTGCGPEDLSEAMNDREKWRDRVRDIRATSATWWWWWWQTYISVIDFFLLHSYKTI